ncbi:MAG: cyclic nucleotide-binding domain-containing protein [Alphaproteobacteria bacterium]|nr:cyclic nucleotide-binding domain-containing protein [Alphaproteobacteria bacterium]
MLLEDDVNLLKTIPLFSKIEPNKLKLIAFTGERLIFKKGDVIFNKGEEGQTIMIILEGEANVVLPTQKHVEPIAIVKKGEIIGEIATLCNIPRTMTLIARTDSIFLSLTKELFLKLIREIPDLAVQIIHDLAKRLANTIEQFEAKIALHGDNNVS